MIKVLRHGDRISVRNPITDEEQEMINVVFVEEGRSGADATMSGSSELLSRLTGRQVGLNNLRIHTQPVLANTIGDFKVGKEFDGAHINRGLYSTPQLRKQEGLEGRNINGNSTYFKTWIEDTPKEDIDYRASLNVVASVDFAKLSNAKVGAAAVRVLESAGDRESTKGGRKSNLAETA